MSGSNDVIEGWVDTKVASELTGYSLQAIRWIAKQGRIEARKIGKSWLINKADLLQYKAEMDALGDQRHDPRRNPQWIESKRQKIGGSE
ncbi:MAG: helix-turn-helix domain-containing protein [Chloroflexi bacterium]|nr:helix-turn-helix domain-containing protein [Chloroflexota bacterium]